MRVVSLVPSVTETLLAWGVTPVACTRFCEQDQLTHVGGTKNPDIAAIVALAPDLVVMEQDENRLEDHQELSEQGIDVEVLHVTSVEAAQTEMGRLADRLNLPPDLVPTLPNAPNAPNAPDLPNAPNAPATTNTTAPEQVAPAALNAPTPLKAFVPIWRKPWMTINGSTYGASLLSRLGVQTVFSDHQSRYPTVTASEIQLTKPDLVLAPTEPYPFVQRHLPELTQFAPAHLIDGQDLFWWGARTPAALKRLQENLRRLR